MNRSARKRVLFLCPFRIMPAHGGGALRAGNLLRQLAAHHDVQAILPRHGEAHQVSGAADWPDNIHFLFPEDSPHTRDIWDKLPSRLGIALKYRWLRRSLQGPANSFLLKTHHLIRKACESHPDVVVMEELDSACAAPFVRRLVPSARLIVDMYNCNGALARQQGASPRTIGVIDRQERSLKDMCDSVWVCSDDDSATFEALGANTTVIPNGVDTELLRPPPEIKAGSGQRLLFCGSLGYPPNLDGLYWFSQSIWPQVRERLPDVSLTIIGRGDVSTVETLFNGDPAVHIVGPVPDTAPYYHAADIALCPLRQGSGTRLKLLEAMAMGTPSVSTAKGAEGLNVVHGEHLLRADTEEAFVNAIADLASNREQRRMISRQGRALVESTYAWPVIGRHASDAVSGLCDPVYKDTHGTALM